MKTIIAIGAGSFIGGVCRYILSVLINTRSISSFPYGTLSVNLLGSLLIGLLYGLANKGWVSGDWKLFLITGVLGGFTTFSAFSLETFTMIREGNVFSAILYAAASIGIGILFTYLGYTLSSKF